jgi:hypothetical protein
MAAWDFKIIEGVNMGNSIGCASNFLKVFLVSCLVIMAGACTGNSSSNSDCPSDEERCELRNNF